MDEINVQIEEVIALEASINAAAVTYEGGGTTCHSQLTERGFPDQHPIAAITGLNQALESRISTDKLQDAVENALTLAKESGDFKGEKGDTGAQGPQGEKGEKGDSGAVGPQGPQGEKGESGAQGPQGQKGEKGDTGARGEKGEKGDTGERGEKGEDGTGIAILGSYASESELISSHPTGNIGDAYMIDSNLYVWSAGENNWINAGNIKGEKGDVGDTGPQGPKGEKGDTGAAGANGADGKTPVKGTDYFTDADKTEMVGLVLAALPTWNGGNY